MEDLLYLCHRIPYPPNKGDKIRSFNIIKYISRFYRVHLAAFIDDRNDWREVERLGPYCESMFFADLKPGAARIKSIKGFFSGQALTIPYYKDPGLMEHIVGVVKRYHIRRALVFSGAMAQYLQAPELRDVRAVVDFVDVDSDKWRQYSMNKHWPMNWLYGREADRLLAFEARIARQTQASVFVSREEADLFRKLAQVDADKVHFMDNGVDTGFFDPSQTYESPYGPEEEVIVFTGAMDYWANVEAVSWFVREVLPRIQKDRPGARFYIVGSRPTEAVQKLARSPGVFVTGTVADIRPYLAGAALAVAPLRIARGVQNKVLEAMAMGKVVVATPQAMEGIDLDLPLGDFIFEEPEAMARRCLALMADPGYCREAGRRGREAVIRRYDWDASLAKLRRLLSDGEPAREAAQTA